MDNLELSRAMSVHTRGRVPGDDVIEGILNSGGQYAVVENPASQQEWEYLVDYLNQFPDPIKIKVISLPVDVCFYSLAYSETKLPTFYVTAKETGEMVITIDSKGSFVPDLTVEGSAGQTALGNDIYEIKFATIANYAYEIEINEPLTDKGLYSIVARHKKKGTGGGLCEGTLITTGAALKNGNVYVWGFRGSAQQGNGVRVVKHNSAPAKVASLSNVMQLTAGAYHLLALDAKGDIYGWGQNIYGEAGAPQNYVDSPHKVMGNAVQVAAGEYCSIALDANGQVWTWGHNLYGQLGNGTKKNSRVPVYVNLQGEKSRLIGAAYEGAFAVTKEGHVWAWGDNEASGLGFPGSNYGVQRIILTPTRVTNLDRYAKDIVYIAGGNGWGEALLNDGRVIGWGLHASLGLGISKTNVSNASPVVIMDNVKQLFARYVGSFALTNDGKIYTWGQTGGSAFPMVYGSGATLRNNANQPITRIGGGKEHLFYETADGRVYGVGYNDLYKLNQGKLGGIIDWPGSEIFIS